MHRPSAIVLIPFLVVLGACASGPSTTTSHHVGDSWHAFQEDEYRVYFAVLPSQFDSCHVSAHVIGLLTGGLLRGKFFYLADHIGTADVVGFLASESGEDSSNRWLPTIPSHSTKYYPRLDDDLANFRGRPVYIEFPSLASYHCGLQRDTMEIFLSVDLTGIFPGPMRIYRIIVSFDSVRGRCTEPFRNSIVEQCRFEGWIV
jgi:hypothetical protein